MAPQESYAISRFKMVWPRSKPCWNPVIRP